MSRTFLSFAPTDVHVDHAALQTRYYIKYKMTLLEPFETEHWRDIRERRKRCTWQSVGLQVYRCLILMLLCGNSLVLFGALYYALPLQAEVNREWPIVHRLLLQLPNVTDALDSLPAMQNDLEQLTMMAHNITAFLHQFGGQVAIV